MDGVNKLNFEGELTKKLARFRDVASYPNCIEISSPHAVQSFALRGQWATNHFGNAAPINLELACGKGEYSIGQARLAPERNFIGVDIKGNRIWKGATEANKDGLNNVAFLRTHIDHIDRLFGPEEVDNIWIIFPDPQPGKARKRLTSPMFIERYQRILRNGGTINLKTDDRPLFDYTLEIIAELGLVKSICSFDLYADLAAKSNPELNALEDVLRIKTYYEGRWLAEGRTIHYVQFGFA